MRLVSASLALVLLSGCGQPAGRSVGLNEQTVAGGIELALVQVARQDEAMPWRQPLSSRHCVVYTVRVRAVDHGRHDLRPDAFAAGGGSPADAVGRCNTPEIEPVWITDRSRLLQITILEREPEPAPLVWRPRD